MGGHVEQDAVLRARGLALGRVDDDDGSTAGAPAAVAQHGLELAREREPRAARGRGLPPSRGGRRGRRRRAPGAVRSGPGGSRGRGRTRRRRAAADRVATSTKAGGRIIGYLRGRRGTGPRRCCPRRVRSRRPRLRPGVARHDGDHPGEGGDDDGGHAPGGGERHPAARGVRPDPDAVHDPGDPRGIRGEVDEEPGAVRHPGARERGRDDDEREVQGEGAQAEPERLVGAAHRHQRLPPADVDVLVDDGAEGVGGQQQHRERGEGAVQSLGDEPRPQRGRRASGGEHAEHHRQREDHEQHDTRAAVEVPEQGRGHESSSMPDAVQAGVRVTRPSSSTSRAATSCSHEPVPGVGPEDDGGGRGGVGRRRGVAERRHGAQRPGCGGPGPRVEEVVPLPAASLPAPGRGARRGDPPLTDPDHRAVATPGQVGHAVPDDDGVQGGVALGRRHPHVAAHPHEHGGAALGRDAEGDEVGGEGLAGGPEVERRAAGHRHGGGGDVHVLPPAARHRQRGRGRVVRGDEGEGAVVACSDEERAEGRVDEPVGLPRRLEGHPQGTDEDRGHGHRRARTPVGTREVAVVAEAAARLRRPRRARRPRWRPRARASPGTCARRRRCRGRASWRRRPRRSSTGLVAADPGAGLMTRRSSRAAAGEAVRVGTSSCACRVDGRSSSPTPPGPPGRFPARTRARAPSGRRRCAPAGARSPRPGCPTPTARVASCWARAASASAWARTSSAAASSRAVSRRGGGRGQPGAGGGCRGEGAAEHREDDPPTVSLADAEDGSHGGVLSGGLRTPGSATARSLATTRTTAPHDPVKGTSCRTDPGGAGRRP